MIIIAMGYSGTGSSAIVHLLKEYEYSYEYETGSYEHLLFYTPHGLFDLEDAILRSNSIYRSDAAINEFYEEMKKLNEQNFGWFGGYRDRFGNGFMCIVDEFVQSLIEFSRKGGWSYDYKIQFNRYTLIKDSVKRLLGHSVRHPGYVESYNGEDGVVNFCFDTPDEFYKKAKKFVYSYLSLLGYQKEKALILDQLFQPQHLIRISKYFNDDVRCIVADRDPRDMFILSKYIWSRNSGFNIFPEDPVLFSHFYRRLINTEMKVDDPRIMRIHFEDMIYNYKSTVNDIEEFVGKSILGNHVNCCKYFDPNTSIHNTQNYMIKKEWTKEVECIERDMKDNLYPFPYKFTPKIEDTSDPFY